MTIKRCYPVLVGASVAENQLLTNLSSRTQTLGITITANSNGSITALGTATADNNLWFKQNFPFMANRVYLLKGSKGNGWLGVGGSYSARDTGEGCLYKFSSNNSLQIVYGFSANTTYNETLFPEIIDITLMLGSSIADYVYQLETANAGSGIAWLRSYDLITDEYKPYNTGTIESVEATAKVVRDENNENAVTYPLGTDTLRGIFKLDANNKLYADGDRKKADGTITRKYGVLVLDKNANIQTGGYNMPFKILIPDKKRLTSTTAKPNGIANKLTGVSHASAWGIEYTFSFTINNDVMYFKLSDSITTIANAKTYLDSNPITIVYELATPTTETSTPFQSPQVCYPDGTEEFVTENGVPVGHETKYQL